MKYKPELGFFGNLERAFEEMTKTNNKVFNTQNDVQRVDARVASNEEVNNITFVALAETQVLDDDTAARHAEVFPKWEAGVTYKAGQMRVDLGGRRIINNRDGQAHTSVDGWNPSLTPAMWVLVDVTHAGTMEDPMIAGRGMEYVKDLYYFDEEDGNLYLCTRSGTLHYMPHELVGQYFELVAE